MRILRLLPVLALAALVVPATAAGAPRPVPLPPGATIAGVPVAGLGPRGAERAVRAAVRPVFERPLTVRVGTQDRLVWPRRAGLDVRYAAMVENAYRAVRRAQPVAVPLSRRISSDQLSAVVRGIGRAHYSAPRDATVRFGIAKVRRVPHRMGSGVDARALRRALVAELLRPTPERLVLAGMRTVRPKVTLGQLTRVHHTYVSIDRGSFRLRLFKRLRLVRTYPVAVGAAGYDTPSGLQRILSKTKDPAWYVPRRPWAGALAGQVIAPSDPRNPLKARFLSIGNGYGIHGTAQEGSIGARASHGCIRMRVRDVKLLYDRVPVGTPVLIR
jgi:lipoprotein-anchoring transpeptidase ErfK/SrfK